MATATCICTMADSGQTDDELASVSRANALAAMSKEGVVDESTLRVEEISRNATLNFGNYDEPLMVNLFDRGLVAVMWTAEGVMHEDAV